MKLVSVNILITNEKKYIKRCVEAVLSQTYPNIEIFVIDNASTDGSQEFIKNEYSSRVTLIENKTNLGCAGGNNKGIEVSNGEYVMPVDVNLFMTSNYVEEMVKGIEASNGLGMVQGRLYNIGSVKELEPKEKIIDSVGVYPTKDRRNFDRGHGKKDDGKYNKLEEIFGAGGAAPLYRRKMLDEVKIEDEWFDETFFIYREEIDFNWRAQLFGWKCVYLPTAKAYHIRTYTPAKRKNLSRQFRYLQFRNRYLMIIKNDLLSNIIYDFFCIFWFELKAFAYVCLFEPFLFKAYLDVIRLFPQMYGKRKIIMNKKCVTDEYIKKWFV